MTVTLALRTLLIALWRRKRADGETRGRVKKRFIFKGTHRKCEERRCMRHGCGNREECRVSGAVPSSNRAHGMLEAREGVASGTPPGLCLGNWTR